VQKIMKQQANQVLLQQFRRLHAGEHLIGRQTCVLHASLGIDTQATALAPGGEMVWVYVYTDNPDTFCLLSLAAYLGIPQPLIKRTMEFVTVLKHGQQPGEVFALEPSHTDRLNLLAHEVSPVVETRIVPPGITNISAREQALIDALSAIVAETMAYPAKRPQSADSYLPEDFVLAGIRALGAYHVFLPCYREVA